jgi:hypothetical protein
MGRAERFVSNSKSNSALMGSTMILFVRTFILLIISIAIAAETVVPVDESIVSSNTIDGVHMTIQGVDSNFITGSTKVTLHLIVNKGNFKNWVFDQSAAIQFSYYKDDTMVSSDRNDITIDTKFQDLTSTDMQRVLKIKIPEQINIIHVDFGRKRTSMYYQT